tara:strand:+ start:3305 stop:4306 length:1002 start_codon:yes stop_codon:yes gene_type:complete
MTFREIVDDVLDKGSQGSGGDAEAMVKSSVNNTYREVLSVTGTEHKKREFSLVTVASTSKYGLPLYVKSILNIEDSSNTKSVEEITSTDYDNLYPGNTDTGDPDWYYSLGKFGTQKLQAVAGGIKLSSSSSSDGSVTGEARYVTVVGTDYSTGGLIREKSTMNGTSTVTTTQAFSSVERIVKSYDDGVSSFSGSVTVKDSSDNTIALIPTWVDSPSYLWIEFYPIPDSVITYTVRAMAFKPDLVFDEDWPEIDEDFHNLLVYGACAEILPAFGKAGYASMMKSMYDDKLSSFQSLVDPRPNLVLQASDVHAGSANLPRHPWIKGVHRSLADAQ